MSQKEDRQRFGVNFSNPMHRFRVHIIKPTLLQIGLYSHKAEVLLAGTLAQESDCFHYRKQTHGGPALGLYQMEPGDHLDIWNNFLRYHTGLARKIKALLPDNINTEKERFQSLYHHDRYATAMARVHYLRVSEPLPSSNDVVAIAGYWKRHYNTYRGAGTVRQFIQRFNKCVRGTG